MTAFLYIMAGWLTLNVAFVLWRLSVASPVSRTQYPRAGKWTHAS